MSLSDRTLQGYFRDGVLLADPCDPYNLQPASIEVHLDSLIRVPRTDLPPWFAVDPAVTRSEECFRDHYIRDDGYWLASGGIALASTVERVHVPDHLEVILDGISSLGRWFVTNHQTAGYGDPGFCGNYVLEIKNHLPWPFLLRAGMRIGQLRFQQMVGKVDRPYGSAGNRYQGQTGVVGSRAYLDTESEQG